MRRFAALLFFLCASVANLAATDRTHVTGLCTYPDATFCAGTVTVSSQTVFIATGGVKVSPNDAITKTIASDGTFAFDLYPNEGSSPSGTRYVFRYKTSKSSWTEYCAVTVASPMSLSTSGVCVTVPPAPPSFTLSVGPTGPQGPPGEAQEIVNAQTGSTYTFLSSDAGKVVYASTASATNFTLPVFSAGFKTRLYCDIPATYPGSVCTVTPASGTIRGAATLTVQPGEAVEITVNGANYLATGIATPLRGAQSMPDSATWANVSTAATLTLGAAGSVTNGVHHVCFAFWSDAGHSGDDSGCTSITVTGNKKIHVTNVPVGPPGTTGLMVKMTPAGVMNLGTPAMFAISIPSLNGPCVLPTITNNSGADFDIDVSDTDLIANGSPMSIGGFPYYGIYWPSSACPDGGRAQEMMLDAYGGFHVNNLNFFNGSYIGPNKRRSLYIPEREESGAGGVSEKSIAITGNAQWKGSAHYLRDAQRNMVGGYHAGDRHSCWTDDGSLEVSWGRGACLWRLEDGNGFSGGWVTSGFVLGVGYGQDMPSGGIINGRSTRFLHRAGIMAEEMERRTATTVTAGITTHICNSGNIYPVVGDPIIFYGGTGNWAGLNGLQTVVSADGSCFDVNVDSRSFGAVTGTITMGQGAPVSRVRDANGNDVFTVAPDGSAEINGGDLLAHPDYSTLSAEYFAQNTFTPSHTKWYAEGDFSFVGDVPTYLATGTASGAFYQLPEDLVTPATFGAYRFSWTLANVTAGDIVCYLVGDTTLGRLTIAAGAATLDFILQRGTLPLFPPSLSCTGTSGGFEITAMSLKKAAGSGGTIRAQGDVVSGATVFGITIDGEVLRAGNMRVYGVTRTIGTTAGDTVMLGHFPGNDRFLIEVTLGDPVGTAGAGKTYTIVGNNEDAAVATWREVLPLYNSGNRGFGTENYTIDVCGGVCGGAGYPQLRLRRTTTTGYGPLDVLATIKVYSGGTFVEETTSGSSATVSGIYRQSAITQVQGKVGIGKADPAVELDVAGNVAATSFAFPMANASSTGTTLNKLAKLTGAPSTAVIAGTSDTSGIIGLVIAGAGTTGTAQIATSGLASCVFDGATTAGNYVQISSGTAGDCHDAGASLPASGQIIGRVLSTNGSGGTYQILLMLVDR